MLTGVMTEIDAANGALALIGEPALIALDDDRHAARVISQNFGHVRDALLVEHTWNFALNDFLPASDGPADELGRYWFVLHPDCLQVISVDGLTNNDWVIRAVRDPSSTTPVNAKMLVCKVVAPEVRAIWRVGNPALWSPLFIDVFQHLLAAKIAALIPRATDRADEMEEKAARKLFKAQRRDAQEGVSQKYSQESPWVNARRSGRWG